MRGTFQWMKSVNKTLVLNTIRKHAPISRAEIAKTTGLTPPTVSAVVKEFLEEALLRETSEGTSSGGRKPTMLELNSRAHEIVSLDVGPETIEGMRSDLSGTVLETAETVIHKGITKEELLLQMEEIVSALKPKGRWLGIGVGMHGVVDSEKGEALYAPNLDLQYVPIKERLEQAFSVDVRVENDARVIALGESWFGGYDEADSLLAVNVGRGVGGGIMIGKALYRGEEDLAGEIGHIVIDRGGPLCSCGNRGCLQALVSGDAISELYGKSGEELGEEASQGEEEAVIAFRNIGQDLGTGILNAIHLINPTHIVLTGGVMGSADHLMPSVHNYIRTHGLTEKARKSQVQVSEVGGNSTLLGAAALVMQELFYHNLES